MAVFRIKQNDRLPVFQATVVGAGDLTGATVAFHMRKVGSTTVLVNSAGTVESYDSATDTNVLQYDWADGDTAGDGHFQAEFEATLNGKPLTTPTRRFHAIVIYPEIA